VAAAAARGRGAATAATKPQEKLAHVTCLLARGVRNASFCESFQAHCIGVWIYVQ
jgi:hypothetical protein